jgi:hypothetical protein
MSPKDIHTIRFDELSLEPLDTKPSIEAPLKGKASFTANTRAKTGRRKGGERREQVRFQDDRRSGDDRRPEKDWEKGKNL